jgi:hypothetical protein
MPTCTCCDQPAVLELRAEPAILWGQRIEFVTYLCPEHEPLRRFLSHVKLTYLDGRTADELAAHLDDEQ